MIRILFFGDIVGKIGRRALIKAMPELKKEFEPDLVLANGENLAHGKGITAKTIREVMNAGINFFTSGDHFWSKKEEAEKVLTENLPIIRPANYSDTFSGAGQAVVSSRKGKVLLINLMGRVFIKNENQTISCPFKKVDEILAKISEIKIKIIDFHAEATSEKRAMGFYLDGRVSAVLGTHTHVPTADEQILPKGTAYISDVGMVGAKESVLGVKKEISINHFLSDNLYGPIEHDMQERGGAIVNAVLTEIDEKTGKATEIKRIRKEVLV